jgi:hypothetical protein
VPPSTRKAAPVTNDASSDARKATQLATSRAVPIRPSGATAAYSASTAAGSWAASMNARVSGVSMIPGQTQLTRMPRGASSTAR